MKGQYTAAELVGRLYATGGSGRGVTRVVHQAARQPVILGRPNTVDALLVKSTNVAYQATRHLERTSDE